MTNVNEVVAQIYNQLNDEERENLLIHYMTNEVEKKVFEVNKNYKDENKKQFELSNITNSCYTRFIKKLLTNRREVVQQLEMSL